MPVGEQLFKLRILADQFCRRYRKAEWAESSFITTAHLEGFQTEYVHEIAASFWPDGYAAKKKNQYLVQMME